MAQITSLALIAVIDHGRYEISTGPPSPGGGNPRFVTHQLRNGMATLHKRMARILEADYGAQEPFPVPAIHHRRLIEARLKAAIPLEVPISLAPGHAEAGTTYRTDADARQLLDALVPVVAEMLVEAHGGAL